VHEHGIEHGVDSCVWKHCLILIVLIVICWWEETRVCSSCVLRCLSHSSFCIARLNGLLCTWSCWCNRCQRGESAASPPLRRIIVHFCMSGQTVLSRTMKNISHVHRRRHQWNTYKARPQVRQGYGLAPVCVLVCLRSVSSAHLTSLRNSITHPHEMLGLDRVLVGARKSNNQLGSEDRPLHNRGGKHYTHIVPTLRAVD
jgi:hypothetical protein